MLVILSNNKRRAVPFAEKSFPVVNPAMSKKTVALCVLTAFIVVVLFSGCGIKGPPQPPEPKKILASDAG